MIIRNLADKCKVAWIPMNYILSEYYSDDIDLQKCTL